MEAPLQLLVTNLDYDEHKGRIAIGRVQVRRLVVLGHVILYYLLLLCYCSVGGFAVVVGQHKSHIKRVLLRSLHLSWRGLRGVCGLRAPSARSAWLMAPQTAPSADPAS